MSKSQRCVHCGKSFPPFVTNPRYIYCSTDCLAAETYPRVRSVADRPGPRPPTVCCACGRQMYRSPKPANPSKCGDCRRQEKARRCQWCAETFIAPTVASPQKFCSRQCWTLSHGYTVGGTPFRELARNAEKRARRRDATVEKVDALTVFERDGWVCHLCGEPCERGVSGMTPWAPTMDHVLPLARGGEHSYSNIRTAHRRCNTVKGARVA